MNAWHWSLIVMGVVVVGILIGWAIHSYLNRDYPLPLKGPADYFPKDLHVEAKPIPFVIRPQHPNEAIERAFAEGIRSSQGRMVVTPGHPATVTGLAAQQQRRDWDQETWLALQYDLFAEAVRSPRWRTGLEQFEHMQTVRAKGGTT